MKFTTILTPILLALSTTASPTPEPAAVEYFTTLSNTTDSLVSKRAPSGTFNTWASASSGGCTGTPGQSISNPTSGQCYTHGSGTPQTFRRASWGGNSCQITLYSSSNCNAGTVASSTTSGAFCWSGGWEFLSFKLVC
ncbi:hypothetical protein QBC40DRAFT_186380 [Triangularia verruculosa]|uniref:Uncharacterized protein n=1 Tax=Triangularia verruculosa TaxID=2587418 RepID=A0AAN7AQB3_9PEZI|nr:hypothetical protein QBC40DRAFT_186380 [Triangularia verruculosa]